MKRKIIAVIAGILIFGWAYWLVPYSPIPDTVNITEMRVYQLDRGEYADDFTERVDTDTVRELLPQIRARRLPSYHRGISEDCYQIQVVYGGKTVCFSLGEPSYAYEVTESMSPWVHKLSGSEKLLALLDKQ